MRKQKITISKYNAAKLLFKSGASAREVAEYLEIGLSTAQRIKQSENYEDYILLGNRAAYYTKKKYEEEIKRQEEVAKEEEARKEEDKTKPVKSVDISNSYQMNRLIEIMKEQNDILKIISNKIAFVVDELTK